MVPEMCDRMFFLARAEINFTFLPARYWKAIIEYLKTKGVLNVMRRLGLKSIKNTLVYAHIARAKAAIGDFDRFSSNVRRMAKGNKL